MWLFCLVGFLGEEVAIKWRMLRKMIVIQVLLKTGGRAKGAKGFIRVRTVFSLILMMIC